ncbi:MAG: hypothetical protein KME17_00105 [Cyanosarcina radialis HA8281-LM2]|jgi:hypothetical protein|nr:hypothetical protein [Cyanosarcina radialis HA8281-LM2]
MLRFWVTFWSILFIWLFNISSVRAEALTERLHQFPDWHNKPSLSVAKGDLIYPDWMNGIWQVTSTLLQQVAPLAPEIVTPGFDSNRRYLNRPMQFQVRFAPESTSDRQKSSILSFNNRQVSVVADRAFNGKEIALAYLGNDAPVSVKVDPNNPNRQVTFLSEEKQLISTVTARGSETLGSDKFVATEMTQQVFQSQSQIYLNEVETTTAYQYLRSGKIVAQQITAIYLSPQDPDYFQAGDRPVALYRYELKLNRF